MIKLFTFGAHWIDVSFPLFFVPLLLSAVLLFMFILGSKVSAREGFNIFAQTYVVIFGVCYIVMSMGSLIWSNSSAIPQPTARDATSLMGLESGKTYDLEIGSRFGGSSVNADADSSRGFFFASASSSITTRPASALSVGFAKGDKSYILELPVSQITFVQSAGASPSVVIYIGDNVSQAVVFTTDDECEPFRFHNLLPSKFCEAVVTDKYLTQEAERRGLAPVVMDNIDSATITLTPEMYNKLLGTP